jgi:ATP-dependent DNA ligase
MLGEARFQRKATQRPSLADCEAILDGAIIYKHACALGCDGIVSKRLGSPYRSGRADCWVKVNNPTAPAANRLEEDWRK